MGRVTQGPYARRVAWSGMGVVIAAALWAIMLYGRAPTWHGFVMQPPTPAVDFTLTAHTGQPVSLQDFRGKLVLLYFGYTFCPGMCPTTLANLAQVVHQLGKQAQQVQVLMISVDPARDTPARLAAYVSAFHPTFLGVTGTPSDLAAVAPRFGIYYEQEEGTPETGYMVNHSTTVLVVDQRGVMRVIWPFGTAVPALLADVQALLRHGAS